MEIIDPITSILSAYRQGKCPGCAALVTRNGETIYSGVHGYADLENSIRVTESTNFRLASVTKQFTATVILILVQDGLLNLDVKLMEFFPEFPEYAKDINIYHLLTHTSGLREYDDDLPSEYASKQLYDEDIPEILKRQDGLNFAPGSAYRYNNGGYSLLRLIAEKVSGQSFGEFLRTRIFVPLGMSHTMPNEEGITVIPDRAYGYTHTDASWTRTDQRQASTTIGDGGIYSSAHDLFLWEQSLSSEKILKAKTRDLLFKKHVRAVEEGDDIYYGFGFFIKKRNGETVIFHTGSSIGFKICLYRIPSRGLAIIFLSNRTDGETMDICERIVDTISVSF